MYIFTTSGMQREMSRWWMDIWQVRIDEKRKKERTHFSARASTPPPPQKLYYIIYYIDVRMEKNGNYVIFNISCIYTTRRQDDALKWYRYRLHLMLDARIYIHLHIWNFHRIRRYMRDCGLSNGGGGGGHNSTDADAFAYTIGPARVLARSRAFREAALSSI